MRPGATCTTRPVDEGQVAAGPIVTVKLPTPSISHSSLSPGTVAATPDGVPVMMMSPAASATISESLPMTSGTFQIICARSPSCRSLPLALSAMRPLLGWPILLAGFRGPEGPAGRRGIECLADPPGPLHVARDDLQIAPRKVDAHAVSVNAVERLIERDIAPAGLERHHQLHLVMHVLGERGIRHVGSV